MMHIPTDDFMDYMAFRDAALEEKIRECLAAARRGERSIQIDREDLTDEELRCLQREVQRRIENG